MSSSLQGSTRVRLAAGKLLRGEDNFRPCPCSMSAVIDGRASIQAARSLDDHAPYRQHANCRDCLLTTQRTTRLADDIKAQHALLEKAHLANCSVCAFKSRIQVQVAALVHQEKRRGLLEKPVGKVTQFGLAASNT